MKKITNKELEQLLASDLTDIIHTITDFPHRITYYGNLSHSQLSQHMEKHHVIQSIQDKPSMISFNEKIYPQPKVYWSHYDMVQTEMILLARSTPFDATQAGVIRLFNEYFGRGMNSIVFQEIREAQGLAYSVFSIYSQPNKKDFSNYLFSYVGIQADKQREAIHSMFNLINNIPKSEQAFEIAKTSILNKLESERITKSKIIDAYFSAEDKGLKHDIREDVYETVKTLSLDELMAFHQSYVKDLPHNIVLIGHRDKIDFDNLAKYGEVIELKKGDIFRY